MPTQESHKPNEQALEELLKSFQPRPSQAFHQKMEKAPWRHTPRLWKSLFAPGARKTVAVASLMLAFALFVALGFPSLRAAAHTLFQFFIAADSDQIVIEVTVESPASSVFIDPERDFTLSVSEAQALAAYPIYIPASLPADYSFTGANYTADQSLVAYHYKGEVRSLLFFQQPSGNYFEKIGGSAQIEFFQFGDLTVEYVVGGWVLPQENGKILSTVAPGANVSAGAYWEYDTGRQTIRWQSYGYQFEVISFGPMDKDILLSIPLHMQVSILSNLEH